MKPLQGPTQIAGKNSPDSWKKVLPSTKTQRKNWEIGKFKILIDTRFLS